MSKKKSGHKISGDPRKRAQKITKEPVTFRKLKLKEFIDMSNPRDVDSLRLDAIEMKTEDLGDEFLYWYQDRTGVSTETLFQMGFLIVPFFEALLDIGEKDPVENTVNYDAILNFVKEDDKPTNYWQNLSDLTIFNCIIEFMKKKGYESNFEDFKNLDSYKEKMLESEYEFANGEPALYSYPETD